MTESSTERAAGHPIAWEDVRVGDTIERRWTSKGVTYSERGTVAKIDGAYLNAAEGGAVASHYGGKSLFLIDRPKPELPIETGSVILASEVRGERFDPPVAMVADSDGDWHRLGWARIDSRIWYKSEHITEWTLAKVVPA